MPQHTLSKKDLAGINGLNLKDAKASLALGLVNAANITDSFRPEFEARLDAIRDRIRRVQYTEDAIKRLNGSLRGKGNR